MRRSVILFVLGLLLAARPVAAESWTPHVDLGFDVGRAFSIVDGGWMPSSIPSVSVLFGPVTVSTSSYFTGARFFEQDTAIEWYSREGIAGHLTFYANVAHYKYPAPISSHDWIGQVGVRFRLR